MRLGGLLKPDSIAVPQAAMAAAAVGGARVGAGFAVGGYCPGTSVVGAATGRIEAQTVEGAQGCIIPTAGGQVVWLLSSNVVRRSAAAEQPEFVMVPRAKDCRFAADERGKVTAWRWDVELLPAQKQARVKPLFTFTAVPPQEKNQ